MNKRTTNARKLIAVALAVLLLLSGGAPALAEVFSAVVTSDSMTVYGDPALTVKLGTLQKDDVVRVTGFTGTIAKITANGTAGFAKIADMKTVDAVARKAVLNAAAPVYETAATTGRSVNAPKGTKLYVLSADDDWARVERNGKVGYVRAGLVDYTDEQWQPLSAAATPEPAADAGFTAHVYTAVTTGSVKVYQSPSADAKVLGTVKKGVQLNVQAESADGWAKVERKGAVGYCALAKLKEVVVEPTATPAPTKVIVTADSLSVYEGEGTGTKKLGTLKKGQTVNLVSAGSQWARVELDGNYGYCTVLGIAEVSVAPTPTADPLADASTGTVKVKTMSVFASASSASKKLGTLKKGREVNVLDTQNGWAYIELNGYYGYCLAKNLIVTSNEPEPTPTPSNGKSVPAVVASERVAVYQLASVNSKLLGTLKKGREVNVVSWEEGWAYIELNGHYGFCALDALARKDSTIKLPAGFKAASFTATIINPNAKLYDSADLFADFTDLALGASVSVVAYSADWTYVKKGNGYGYVPVSQLSKTAYEPVTGDGEDALTLNKALLSLGYYDEVPGEALNAASVTAVKRFQAACGLEQTGTADQTALRILYGGAAPASELLTKELGGGDKSDDVSRVQARLFALGYLSKSGSLDGQYGNTTSAAVKLFQSTSGITSTGRINAETMKALYSTEARKLPAGAKAADVTASNANTTGSSYLDEVPNGLASTVADYSSGMTNPEKLEYVIYVAQNQLGKPYVYATAGPDKYDCSGLTTYIFKKIDVNLKRSAYDQGYDETYRKVEGWENLKRGDVVCFNTITDSDLSDHVGIYLGDGYFIHASSGGHRVVVSNLTTGYYSRVFSWGRRILN